MAQVHHITSLVLFAAGVAWLWIDGPSHAALLHVTPLIVLGAFTVLIFGTSRMMMAGLHRLVLPGPRHLPWLVLTLVSVGSTGLFAAQVTGAARHWPALAAVVWSIGMLVHTGVFASAHARAGADHARAPVDVRAPWGPLMVRAAVLYGVLGAIALPLVFMGAIPLASVYHLLLPGFVTLFILGIATRILLGVDRSGLPPALLAVMVAAAVTGPALLAWGLARSAAVLRVGAVLEVVAVGLFAIGAAVRLSTMRQRRPSLPAYGLAIVFLLGGLSLGVGFAIDPSTRVLVPVHALVNLLGFVGLFCIGAATDMYAPAARPGLDALRRETRLVTALAAVGVVVASLGAWTGSLGIARVGLGAYLAALLVRLAGAVASARRASGIVRGIRQPSRWLVRRRSDQDRLDSREHQDAGQGAAKHDG